MNQLGQKCEKLSLSSKQKPIQEDSTSENKQNLKFSSSEKNSNSLSIRATSSSTNSIIPLNSKNQTIFDLDQLCVKTSLSEKYSIFLRHQPGGVFIEMPSFLLYYS